MKKLLFGALALFLFVGVGCKKDSTNGGGTTCVLSSEALQGNYKVTAATLQPPNGTETSIYDQEFDECDKDDIYTFSANSVLTVTDAGTVCTPSNSGAGTWNLNGNAITIVAGETLAGTIDGFSCNAFIFVFQSPQGTVRYGFTRQ